MKQTTLKIEICVNTMYALLCSRATFQFWLIISQIDDGMLTVFDTF